MLFSLQIAAAAVISFAATVIAAPPEYSAAKGFHINKRYGAVSYGGKEYGCWCKDSCKSPFRPFRPYYQKGSRDKSGCYNKFADAPWILDYLDPFVPATNVTLGNCFAACKGYGTRYAGIGGDGKQCWCGNDLQGDEVSADKCGSACSGGGNTGCGGPAYFSVYEDSTFGPIGDPDEQISGYVNQGCYWDSPTPILMSLKDNSDNFNLPRFIKSWDLANLNIGYCWGALRGDAEVAGNPSACNTPCTGDPGNLCGGWWATHVYYNEALDSKEPCGVPPTAEPPAAAKSPVIVLKPGIVKTTTIRTRATKPFTSTKTPPGGKGTLTIIIGTLTKAGPNTAENTDGTVSMFTTIKTGGPKAGTSTIFPTDENGSTDIAGTGTKIVTTTTGAGAASKPASVSVFTTIKTGGPKAGIETLFPTDDEGNTDVAGTGTVVITTVTKAGAASKPASVSVFTTIKTGGPKAGIETLFPTDDEGNTDVAGTGTVVITTTTKSNGSNKGQLTTVTVTTPSDQEFTTTKSPAGGKGTVSIIIGSPTDVVDEGDPTPSIFTTIKTGGPKAGTSTIFPTDENGKTDASGTGTVIVTTFSPGASKPATPSIFSTITTTGPKLGTSTIFPTDDNGSTDPAGTGTVIVTNVGKKPYSGRPRPSDKGNNATPSIFSTVTTTGPTAGTSTIFPTDKNGKTDPAGTGKVIVTDAKPATPSIFSTITTTGPTPGTSTIFPTDEEGSTDPAGTGTVIVTDRGKGGRPKPPYTGRPNKDNNATPSIFSTIHTTGPTAGTSTIFPTDKNGKTNPAGTGTVIVTDAKPATPSIFSTITTTGPTPGTSTIFPIDEEGSTDPAGTGTVIVTNGGKGRGPRPPYTGKPGPKTSDKDNNATPSIFTTIQTGGPKAGTSTIFPVDDTGKTDAAGTGTVIVTTTTSPRQPANTDETQPTGDLPMPTGSICITPSPPDDVSKKYPGISFPLSLNPDTKDKMMAPMVSCHNDPAKFKAGYRFKFYAPKGAVCRIDYADKEVEVQFACWNGCIEQKKICYRDYAAKKYCRGKQCWEATVLKQHCDAQEKACKDANMEPVFKEKEVTTKICREYGKFPDLANEIDGSDGYFRRLRLF
ncbi:hypothetical protein H072_5385 [Dactylellina haptotyla CBS 200.50]|uniref:WSC domain-containing protein n=1 Tax=Dactylellina haptotyla (strain CBS 200.50) TaxID=1284197 RepID=S8AHY1_DACHA|nr:hypothetical protein H072_5385 [Dactylellina haptotyla CBS 200.50]